MPKLPVVSGKKVIKALGKIGFEKVSQRNGILHPIDISVTEFIKLLKKRSLSST